MLKDAKMQYTSVFWAHYIDIDKLMANHKSHNFLMVATESIENWS
jgi:hypothetical protein